MHFADLFQALSRYHPLTDRFKAALEKEIILLSPTKNYILLSVPNVSTHAYFLVNGFAVSYSFYEGRKITEAFWKPGEIMVSLESFFQQTPARETIQLIPKSDVYCISYARVMELLDTFPEAQRICRAILVQHYAQRCSRLHDMQRLSAYQRFQKLLSTYPNLERIVSQDAIASYLGITAQSLARMKRKAH